MKETKFKDTEIGKIPQDWDVCLLGKKSEIYRGGSPRPIEEYLTELPDGINWIKIGDVKPGDKYIRKTAEKIKPSGATRSRSVEPGDFILSNSMSFGRPYILAIDGCIHDGWLVIKKYQSTYDKDFLYYVLGSSAIVEQYKSMAAGSSVQNLNKDKVAGVKVIAPVSLNEQKRIAATLTSIDNLISSLDKLIEKKKNIKKGAMQQLLTGKKRLVGYCGEWNTLRLGDCTTIKARIGWQGLTTNEYLSHGEYYLITGSDIKNGRIKWDSCFYVSEDRYSQDKNIQIREKDVLVSKDGTIGKVAYLDKIPGKGTLNSGVFVIRSRTSELSQEYLALVFLSMFFDDFIDKIVAGSTIVHLYQKDIVNFSFPVPPTIEEQTAIARIISGMDNEISALEEKKSKYESIKQGMMQQLLTGKIRLI